MKPSFLGIAAAGLLAGLAGPAQAAEEASQEIVTVGGKGMHSGEDPGCINRLHPAIDMAATAAAVRRSGRDQSSVCRPGR